MSVDEANFAPSIRRGRWRGMLVGALIWVVYEIVSFALGEPREIAAIGITGTSLGVIASIWSHYRDRSHWPIHLFAFAIAMSTALSAWVTRGGDEGMMVFTAIPAMIAYRYFRSRVDSLLVEMEQQTLRLIDTLRMHHESIRAAVRAEPARTDAARAETAAATRAGPKRGVKA